MLPTLLEHTTTRVNAEIDPALHIWGWEIAVYLFLGGLVAGLLILSSLLLWKPREQTPSRILQFAPLLALVLLSLGMGALFLDLAYKLHVFRFYLAFRPTSPMSWGAWILVLIYPVAALSGLLALGPEARAWLLKKLPLAKLLAWAETKRQALLGATLAGGVGLGIYTGLLLGTLTARIQWNTAVLGPLFLTSGLSSGAAFLLLFKLDEVDRHRLVRWDMLALVVEAVLIAAMLLGFANAGAAGQLAADALLGGAWTASFWSLVVVMGIAVPLLLEGIEIKKHLPLVAVTPTLVLLGGFALRAVLLAAGQDSGFRLLP